MKYALVTTSWKAFASDIAVKSRDAIKIYQERYNVNSLICHNVLLLISSLFAFNKILLFFEKLAFDGFYPLLEEL